MITNNWFNFCYTKNKPDDSKKKWEWREKLISAEYSDDWLRPIAIGIDPSTSNSAITESTSAHHWNNH
jgi:hypothetical protein